LVTDHETCRQVRIPILVLYARDEEPGTDRRPSRAPQKGVEVPEGNVGKIESEQYDRLFKGPAPSDGVQKVFYEGGGLLREFTFQGSKLHGMARAFRGTGELLYRQEFRDGKEILMEKYDRNGDITFVRDRR
jgi:antitoxin component YwqK of YwqJK toxin-antitoxin module